jgi:peptidoglycan hydrolase-like amidase
MNGNVRIPTIPEFITVHLGYPDSDAPNVTVPFVDYIANVASSEIYPTWPSEALKANILAQISVALNRVYTEFYRSKGYDFDITSSPAYDQVYSYQRDIYSNISQILRKDNNYFLIFLQH